jgi:hypothetical protein
MFLDNRLANTPRWFLTPPKDWGMRVPDTVLNCVVYVGRTITKGSVQERRFVGTAFAVEVKSNCGKYRFTHLVTARHVADALAKSGNWFVRFNTSSGAMDAEIGQDALWCCILTKHKHRPLTPP